MKEKKVIWKILAGSALVLCSYKNEDAKISVIFDDIVSRPYSFVQLSLPHSYCFFRFHLLLRQRFIYWTVSASVRPIPRRFRTLPTRFNNYQHFARKLRWDATFENLLLKITRVTYPCS